MSSPADLIKLAAHDPENWILFKGDFQNTLNTGIWETVKDSSATAAVGADADKGTLILTSQATTDDDGALVQSINEFFKPAAGKRAALSVYVKCSDGDQQELFFGFAQTAATNPEACLTASNRMGFQCDDGSANILLKCEATDLETSKDSEQDMGDDTYVKLSMFVDGVDRVHFYVNDAAVGSIASNIAATELGVSMYHLSGNNSGTHSKTFKNLVVAVER